MALMFFPRIISYDIFRNSAVLSQAFKFTKIQSANITSKENRDPNVIKPAPWPYKTKKFGFLRGYIEGTSHRFDENTKIIVVDGNIGAGKSTFAKQLADALDMVYFPEPTLARYYITDYGFDLRKINELLPPSYKICDIEDFYKNPYDPNATKMQYRMFMFRLEDYIDALAHVLNTGQGVVMERSVYSDFVFMETMFKFGYVSPGALQLYKDQAQNSIEELMRPHLIIYLDISPEVALERIKQRGNPAEINSKVLTKEYLETIEYFYKQKYLKKMEKHAELLIYDWSNYGDVETVVEDVERLDFEKYSFYDNKMCDWRREDDWEWNHLRRLYTNDKNKLMGYAVIFRPKVEEVFHPGGDYEEFCEIIRKIPGEQYSTEFNPSAGDSWLFKMNHTTYRTPARQKSI